MKSFMTCAKCGKSVVKKYGFADMCNLCYTKSLNLSARQTMEMQKLKDELKLVKAMLKTLRTTLGNHKLSLQTAARKNEKLKAENNELESFFAVTFKEIGKG
jgi:NMD protein affecting ribosome stability and mRNA decay